MKLKPQIQNLAAQLRDNDHPDADLRQDTAKVLEDLSEAVSKIPDNWTYRIAVLGIGLTVLTVAIGGIFLYSKDPEAGIPGSLVALGSTALGGLVGLLAPSPTGGG